MGRLHHHQPADFSVGVSATNSTTIAGGSTPAIYNVTVSPLYGPVGTVNLAAAGLPGGSSYTFSPASLSGGGSATLAVYPPGGLTGSFRQR